jgi:hypothetical protein
MKTIKVKTFIIISQLHLIKWLYSQTISFYYINVFKLALKPTKTPTSRLKLTDHQLLQESPSDCWTQRFIIVTIEVFL